MGHQDLPVARGRTFYGPTQTIPTTYEAASLAVEGTEAVFAHTDPSDPTKILSNRKIKGRLMRNVSGITMFAQMGVVSQSTYRERRFNGYSATTAGEMAGIIDDHLGSAGVRNGDLCWVLYDGPVICEFGGGAAITAGTSYVSAATAANSTGNSGTATTTNNAGRCFVLGPTFTVTQTTDGTAFNAIRYTWGVALTARTTGNTATTVLVDLKL